MLNNQVSKAVRLLLALLLLRQVFLWLQMQPMTVLKKLSASK